MTRDKATKVLLKAIDPYRRQYLFDANLYQAGLISPSTERAHKRLAELDKALAVLLGPQQMGLFGQSDQTGPA